MGMSTLAKRTLIVSSFAATVALAPAVPAAAAAAIPCTDGYVCVALLKGTIISVPEGQSQAFPGGVTMAGIANQTKTPYCVGGVPNFALAPAAEIIRSQTISQIVPGQVCLT
jgi:hypothetical protein